MNWSPSKTIRSSGSRPEIYRRIIHDDDVHPPKYKEERQELFGDRRSPTFSRRLFKEVWNDPPSGHRISDRPRTFMRVLKPRRYESEFDDVDIPTLRSMERDFHQSLDDDRSNKFDNDFETRFSSRSFENDVEDDLKNAQGCVHHIPILVERKIEELKSRFNPNTFAEMENEEQKEDWGGPQVQNMRRNLDSDEKFRYDHTPNANFNSKPQIFQNNIRDHWDPHAIHTLPTRKSHKSSQSFSDSRHPVSPKSVHRSHSETHEDLIRSPQNHSTAFRSHSDGHCPKNTFVTKVDINLSPETENEELHNSANPIKRNSSDNANSYKRQTSRSSNEKGEGSGKWESPAATGTCFSNSRQKNKLDGNSLQQIAVILQNVEDLIGRVEAYNGTGRDRQFRFLDEMLTRCMLRLDDVDTQGREDIRNARKTAVREVQNCIDMLEAKAYECEERNTKKDNKYTSDSISINKDCLEKSTEDSVPMDTSENRKETISVDNEGKTKEPVGKTDIQKQPIPLDKTEIVKDTVSLKNTDVLKEPIPLSYSPIRDEPIFINESPLKNKAIPLADKPQVSDGKNEEGTKL